MVHKLSSKVYFVVSGLNVARRVYSYEFVICNVPRRAIYVLLVFSEGLYHESLFVSVEGGGVSFALH